MQAISDAEKKFIIESADLNVRADGRGRLDYRALSVETGLLPQANGSSRLRLVTGGTDVLTSVKAEVSEPLPGHEKEGRMECAVECWSSASPQFEGRGAAEINAELTRTLSSILTACGCLDLESLCILPGKRCWVLYLDIVVFESGGSIVDALTAAAYAALRDARLPKLNLIASEEDLGDADIEIDEDPTAGVALDVSGIPMCVTFYQIGKGFLVDVDIDEEFCATSTILIGVNRKGSIVAITTSGVTIVTPVDLRSCVEAAVKLSGLLYTRIDAALAVEKE